MIIVGYHGTSQENADKIIQNNRFKLSNDNKDWLGEGIYFYVDYSDALSWTKVRGYQQPSVLHCLIEASEDEVLDFDTDKGKKIFENFKSLFYTLGLTLSSIQQNQCAVMNFIWQNISTIKVIMNSFATTPSTFQTLTDGRIKRKEFCVRSNDSIKCIDKVGVI